MAKIKTYTRTKRTTRNQTRRKITKPNHTKRNITLCALVTVTIAGLYIATPRYKPPKGTVAPAVKSQGNYPFDLTCCDDPLSMNHINHMGMERIGLLRIEYKQNKEDPYELLPH